MGIGYKGVERLPLNGVSGVPRQNAHLLHALSHSQVLHRGGVCANFGAKSFHEPPQSFSTEDISSPAAHVALFNIRLEPPTKIQGVFGWMIGQDPAQVVYDHVSVIVCLQKPVGLIPVFLHDVVESAYGFPVQLIPTLLGVQADCGKIWIIHRAYEHYDVTVTTPCGFHVPSFLFKVTGTGHNPTQNTHTFVKIIG